ncbi:MAG: TIGR02281 family clan AA aspartic protease [Thiotrichaceae bacterium]
MDEDQPQRIGKVMIITGWLLVLGMLTMLFNNMLEHQRNPNQTVKTNADSNGTQEVILQRNRSGHYIATGALNNQAVNFLIDTGATWVSIPERIANEINLVKGIEMEVSTANGVIKAYATQVNTVTLGTIKLHNVKASINPHASDDDILLGMSFLKELEIIQRGDTLILRQYR